MFSSGFLKRVARERVEKSYDLTTLKNLYFFEGFSSYVLFIFEVNKIKKFLREKLFFPFLSSGISIAENGQFESLK